MKAKFLPYFLAASDPGRTRPSQAIREIDISFDDMGSMAGRRPKYQRIFDTLERDILSGRLVPGARLPSEAALVKRFGASRITVGRAVRDLQQGGLVVRRAGAGTFVRGAPPRAHARSFGVLIPDLGEAEIFDPICQGLLTAPLGREHALLFGRDALDAGERKDVMAWHLCRQYIDRQVAGVFFAPLEHLPAKDDANARIAQALADARIPIVLLDRAIDPYPSRGRYDLVGIDNRRAGYLITEHLLRLGARRIAFVAQPHAASTVDARLAGYREALHTWQVAADPDWACPFDPSDRHAVQATMRAHRPEAIVCANDRTAARLMHVLIDVGYAIPSDVRLTGIDDVGYAEWLPVPLTTLRQPCREIGAAAISAMLDRLAHPSLPPRDIFLHCSLVVRQSCGAASGTRAAASPAG
jgi:DNA-binding LacI/PurR family transcriptional regulator